MGVRLTRERQAQAVHQAGVDRGGGDAGDGDEDQGVDVAGGEPGLGEAVQHGAGADLLGDADPGVVRLAPGGERVVLVDRQGEMAAAHQDVPVQALQSVEIEVAVRPALPESREKRLLIVVVGRERPPDGGYSQVRKDSKFNPGRNLAQCLPASGRR